MKYRNLLKELNYFTTQTDKVYSALSLTNIPSGPEKCEPDIT